MRPSAFRIAPLLSILVVLALGARPEAADAQVEEADSAAVLVETARTFEARGRWDVAAAIYALVVERYPATPAAAVARQRLAAAPRGQAGADGRAALRVWSTLYGAWLGVAAPGAFGSDSPEPYGLGLLLGGPGGFLIGRSVGRAAELTEGEVSVISLGAWLGTWQGFGWQAVFELGVAQDCPPGPGECFDSEDSSEEAFTAAIVGGLVGIGAGALLSRRAITPGTGTAMNFGPLWGTWFGLAGGVLADLEGDDLLAATLVGSNVGLVTTAALAPGWNVSRSRARLVSIAGVLGGLAGVGIDLLAQPESEKVAIAIPLVGSVAGLAIGIATTGDDAPSTARQDDPGEGAALPGPLLDLRDGRLSLGAPLPTPGLVPALEGRGWQPVLRVGLFRATF